MDFSELFLIARALLPYAGATSGWLLAGAGVGAFLVALCAMCSGQFRFLCGDPGVALGLAILISISLRAWGATYDFTLGRSGAVLGWLIIGITAGLFWNLLSGVNAGRKAEKIPLAQNALEGTEADQGRRAGDRAPWHGWENRGMAVARLGR